MEFARRSILPGVAMVLALVLLGGCDGEKPAPGPGASAVPGDPDGPMMRVVDESGVEPLFSVHAVSLHADVYEVLLAAWEDGKVIWNTEIPRGEYAQPRILRSTGRLRGTVPERQVRSVNERLRACFEELGLGRASGPYSLGITYVLTVRGSGPVLWLAEPESRGREPTRLHDAWDALWRIAIEVIPEEGVEPPRSAARLTWRR